MVNLTRVLVIGASGMLGNAILRFFADSEGYLAFGSVRSIGSIRELPGIKKENIVSDVDVASQDVLLRLFAQVRPDIVINCVGLVKQLAESTDVLASIPINTMLPHRLAHLCEMAGARLIHLSTDCVFSGLKGMYTEGDLPDADDLYGKSKLLGEVDYPHAITLRTSIIGHELSGKRSLVNWFLSSEGEVKGYSRAIFSGLPTVEIARLIRDHVIPHGRLRGLYHVSAEPISKLELLRLIAHSYDKNITIIPDESVIIDRSLDSSRFRAATGFVPRPWPELVQIMRNFS